MFSSSTSIPTCVAAFADCVTGSADAIAKLGDRLYYFVLLDAGLPDDGAKRVLDRIREIPAPQRPIIVVTTGDIASTRSFDVELVQIVLRRPLDIGQLAELIGSCVRHPLLRRSSPRASRPPLPQAGEGR